MTLGPNYQLGTAQASSLHISVRFYTECKGVKRGFSPPFFFVSRLFQRVNGTIGPNLFLTLQLKELEKTVCQRKMRKLTPTLEVNGCKLKNQGINRCKLKVLGVTQKTWV